MSRFINWRLTFLSFSVMGLVAYGLSWFFDMRFWPTFLMVWVAGILNSMLAEHEDYAEQKQSTTKSNE